MNLISWKWSEEKTSTQNKTAEEEFMRKGVKDLTNISRRSNMGRCLRERK